MQARYDFDQTSDRIVYVRKVAVSDLPDELQQDLDPDHPVYAIHAADGERLALARDRAVAFAVARGNAYLPVPVH